MPFKVENQPSVDRFKITELGHAKEQFRKYFGIDIGNFRDNVMTVANKGITIDSILFDEWLHKQFGDYESAGLSMNELIELKFGKSAGVFFKRLL